jgi:hypothetical protein
VPRWFTTGGGFAAQARKQDEHPEIAAFHEEVRNTSMEMVQARIPAKIIEVHALYKVHQPKATVVEFVCLIPGSRGRVRVRVVRLRRFEPRRNWYPR